MSEKSSKEYQDFCSSFSDGSQSQYLVSPICAFYAKEDMLKPQINLEIKSFNEEEKLQENFEIYIKEKKQQVEDDFEEEKQPGNVEAQIKGNKKQGFFEIDLEEEKQEDLNSICLGLSKNRFHKQFKYADFVEFLFESRYEFMTADDLLKGYDVTRLERDDLYFKEDDKISESERKEYYEFNSFLRRIQKVFNLAVSDSLLKALFAALNNFLDTQRRMSSKSSFKFFSQFLYQVMLLRVLGLIDQLMIEKKEKYSLDFMEAIVFCLSRTWPILDLKHQNQIRFCLERIGWLKEKKKSKNVLMQKWSGKDELQSLNLTNRVKYRTNEVEMENIESEKLTDSQLIMEKYTNFKKSLRTWILCEKYDKMLEELFQRRYATHQQVQGLPILNIDRDHILRSYFNYVCRAIRAFFSAI